jgi:hypothetical protein
MGYVKDKFKAVADEQAKEIKNIIAEHGEMVLDKVTIAQAYQGMRGIPGLITETSLLDSNEGIRFRGYSIPELREKLPHAEGGSEHLCYLGSPFSRAEPRFRNYRSVACIYAPDDAILYCGTGTANRI